MTPALRLAFALSLVSAASCGDFDPCAGKSDVCIAVHVDGVAPGLDQLAVTVDQPSVTTKNTPATPRALELPFDFAILLPDGTSGTVNVSVDGLMGGATHWHDAKAATIASRRAKVTISLTTAGPGDDGGIPDLAGADLFDPKCVGITACDGTDGCCPSGCDNTTDSDCAPVCGNNVVETGEVCDDNNHDNGDACDPTCQFRNAFTTLSGLAGSAGFADVSGVISRFNQPMNMAFDGTFLYVTDGSNGVIRKIDAVQGTTTTIAGKAYNSAQTDGPLGTSRVGSLTGVGNGIAVVGGYVYFIDSYPNQLIREIDTSTNTVSTPASLNVSGTHLYEGLATSADGTQLLFVDDTSLKSWKRSDGSMTTIATKALITGATGGVECSSPLQIGTVYYVACQKYVVKISNPGPTATIYAGNATSGCDNADVTSGLTNAKFTSIGQLNADASGNIYFADPVCHTLRKLFGTSALLYGGAANAQGYFNPSGTDPKQARFSYPRAVIPTTIGGSTTYVVDSGNNVIRALGVAQILTFAGGHPNDAGTLVGTKANARYSVPMAGLATDGTTLFAVDGNGKLIKVTIATGDSTQLFDFGIGANSMLLMGGTLYVALSNGTIHTIGTDGTGDTTYAGTAGQTFPVTEGVGVAAVMDPRALATDGTDLYFFDMQRVLRKIDHATKQTSLVAGVAGTTKLADGGIGVGSFGDGNGQLAYANGAMYRFDSDSTNQGFLEGLVLRKIDLATKMVSTIAGNSMAPGGTDGTGTAASFAGATSLTSDGTSIFAMDSGGGYTELALGFSSVVRQIELGTARVTTLGGAHGQRTSYDETGLKARVNGPGPMLFDPTTHAIYFFDDVEGVFRRIK